MVPHLCRLLKSGGTATEHACVALLPLTRHVRGHGHAQLGGNAPGHLHR
jgi:hypothetical protein